MEKSLGMPLSSKKKEAKKEDGHHVRHKSPVKHRQK
jgi:hypothetical protein